MYKGCCLQAVGAEEGRWCELGEYIVLAESQLTQQCL